MSRPPREYDAPSVFTRQDTLSMHLQSTPERA